MESGPLWPEHQEDEIDFPAEVARKRKAVLKETGLSSTSVAGPQRQLEIFSCQ
jgi:hypothetical protein